MALGHFTSLNHVSIVTTEYSLFTGQENMDILGLCWSWSSARGHDDFRDRRYYPTPEDVKAIAYRHKVEARYFLEVFMPAKRRHYVFRLFVWLFVGPLPLRLNLVKILKKPCTDIIWDRTEM